MLMRGSIQRRKPDPSRKPEPRPIIQKAPQQIYHDCGEVMVPSNGEVKIYERRFVRPGFIEYPSINVSGLHENASVFIRATDGEQSVTLEYPIKDGRNDMPSIPVDTDKKFSVWLLQNDAESQVVIDVDVAFVFQER